MVIETYKVIGGSRYWNTNGAEIGIVAVENHWDSDPAGTVGDWGAYIGATFGGHPKAETLEWAMRHGAKLSEEEARFFFPYIAMRYRR